MTISSTTVKNSYSGNGSTTAFAYTFKIFANTDLQVIIRSSTGTETVKTLTTHYTVSGVGDASGGNVTFTSGNTPATGETVVIRRAVPQTQAIDYIANDPFPAESHEEGLDRATMTIQQMQEELNRSFKVSRTNTISSSEFTEGATTRADKALGFDSSGDLTTIANFLPAGGDSAQFQFSTSTTDSDPGAGFFRLNNSTVASATEMYIDDLEFHGTDVTDWIQSWDDVSGNDTNRGRIRISKVDTLDTWMVFRVTGAITDASGYSKIVISYVDTAGTFANNDKVFISFVASGEDGAIPGYFYKFDTGTSDTDPGAGEVAFNNGTYASATEIYINDADANGVTVSTDILTWDDSTSTIRGSLMIYDINDRATYARFNITGASTDASGYVKLTVTHVASNNTFSAADNLSISFSRSGNKGDTGSTGATGSTGSTGATGAAGTNSQLSMTFNNSTSDADPGAGKIAFNNGTLSSVSILYIDDADDASADISTYVQSWDDVSNVTAKGIVTITKEGTPSTYATFKVTGAVTDASGYNKVPVTHLVSAGTFSNSDGVGVHFNYSGEDGSGNMSNVVDDTSPQLGGNLDTNNQEIVTVSNRNIKLTPNGTGLVEVKGNTNPGTVQLNCENNSHGIKLQSPEHSANQSYTLKFPTGNVTADRFLKVDSVSGSGTTGIGQLSFAEVSGGIDWQSTVVTGSTHTASSGQGIWIDTSSNACTVTLPSSPSVGDEIILTDFARNWSTNNLTIDPNSNKFQGNTSPNPVYDTNGESVHIVYSGSSQGWIPIFDGAVALETPQSYSVDFLVVAGGGGASTGNTGGGGAGGYRTSTQTVNSGVAITVTVGNGGGSAGSVSAGSNSSFSGSGLTTITSAGGGEGKTGSSQGGSGGSGGGSGYQQGTGGSGNTPATTPSQGNNGGGGQSGSPYRGGGGGGASQTGQSGPAGGKGGDGSQSSITGSAVYYAGGGGASVEHSSGTGAGGQGGGGAGNNASGPGGNGTANTGGGGGGCYLPNTPGQGGSGVVILSVPTSNYSGTTTGSPTVTTSGSNTIIKFTGSGSYTT